MKRKKLIDGETGLAVQGILAAHNGQSVKTIVKQTKYHKILAQFPEITTLSGTRTQSRQQTLHYIKTTTGQPEACRPRRLAPDRYQAAKAEFSQMMKEDIIRPSKSPWASPLHLVPKENEEWRPCGDYCRLNARTVPDSYPVPHIEDFTQALHEKEIFSTIDLVRAYNQNPLTRRIY